MNHEYTGANWRVSLPALWRHADTLSSGVVYFETGDARFGLYIATWNIQQRGRDADDVVQEFVQSAMQALDEMPEHRWTHAPHLTGTGQALVDSLAPERAYRVITRLIAQPPLVLRAAFHDYAFESVQASNEVLLPLLESVTLVGAA
ncbi:hypothetical protein EII20_13770 [Comamonadaceae bacterium OH2545_COT-014]|nr:hypothetical protein EII20_13770 [Comamonadaceae bacterium OH2545_COT-014]